MNPYFALRTPSILILRSFSSFHFTIGSLVAQLTGHCLCGTQNRPRRQTGSTVVAQTTRTLGVWSPRDWPHALPAHPTHHTQRSGHGILERTSLPICVCVCVYAGDLRDHIRSDPRVYKDIPISQWRIAIMYHVLYYMCKYKICISIGTTGSGMMCVVSIVRGFLQVTTIPIGAAHAHTGKPGKGRAEPLNL